MYINQSMYTILQEQLLERLSPFIRKFNYKTNMISNANIINECIRHDVKRVIFTSSMAVYGRGNPPFDEDEQPSQVDPYGIENMDVS